ncbi:MAG TPA: DNA gyrase inhibitor YacG [Gammaproteobacteria bacterium]
MKPSPRRGTLEVACPNCGATVRWEASSRFRPFCSERCRLIDLGEWVDGGRAIPGDGRVDGEPGPDEGDR